MAAKKMVNTRQSLDDIIGDFNKEKGTSVIVRGSDMKDQRIIRCTSGNIALDVSLGGGWALNQWHEIIGNESSGKTTLALATVAANQAIDPNYHCLWFAAESFIPEWAECFGIDLERVDVVETNVMEDVYALANRALENRAVDCVVIDSLPALVSQEEDDKAMDAFVVGVGARLTGKFFRKSGKSQKRSLVEEDRPMLGIMINQWREKIGITWGDPRTTPGGLAKNYHYFTRVETKRDEWIDVKDVGHVGLTIATTTRKNKSYKPGQEAFLDFYFDNAKGFRKGTFDTVKQIAALGVAADLIQLKGAFYNYDGNVWQGKDKLANGLRDDPKLYAKLYKDVYAFFLPDVEPPALPAPVEAAAKPAKRVVKRAVK